MSTQNERLEILDMIQQGTISAEEGLKLIKAIEESEQNNLADDPTMETIVSDPNDLTGSGLERSFSEQVDIEQKKKYWVIPFWTGVAITILGGALMYWAWAAKGIGAGFILSWIPFLIGIGLLVLGWNSQTGPWLYLQVQQKSGETPERLAFSFPLPIRFTAWGLRTFGRFIPELDGVNLEEIILALGNKSEGDQPLIVEVDDNLEGEKVTIYIG